ncbi:cupin domain-containing protein [Thiovibrio sp. JS02]
MSIIIEQLSPLKREALRIGEWPIWECAPKTFAWHYDEEESCYILAGEVTVNTADQEVHFGPGDFVTFPKGLDCRWTVHNAVRKHYMYR